MPDNMDVLRFIEEVRKRPALWNVTYSEYKDRTNTPQKWQEIADLMGVDVEPCKRKWKNLRDAYRAEVRRAQRRSERQIVSGDYDSKKNFTSKWAYFEPMSFINETQRSKNRLELQPGMYSSKDCGVNDALNDYDRNTLSQTYGSYDIKMEPSHTTDDDDDDDNDKLFEEFESVATPQAARRLSDCIAERDTTTSNCKCPRTDNEQVHFLECLEREEQKLMQSTRQDISRFDTLSHVGDSDYNFLVSFLPQMKKMTQFQNLHFRAKMSDLLLNTMMTSTLSSSANPLIVSNNNTPVGAIFQSETNAVTSETSNVDKMDYSTQEEKQLQSKLMDTDNILS